MAAFCNTCLEILEDGYEEYTVGNILHNVCEQCGFIDTLGPHGFSRIHLVSDFTAKKLRDAHYAKKYAASVVAIPRALAGTILYRLERLDEIDPSGPDSVTEWLRSAINEVEKIRIEMEHLRFRR